ncbi:hypothetical protein [uncultured Friedmanniella sp.]|uniref:hypothetical protein n=1 Tax=uncultured Friedmanniella sp. TaxID=335381 RepID=UPI0035CA6769
MHHLTLQQRTPRRLALSLAALAVVGTAATGLAAAPAQAAPPRPATFRIQAALAPRDPVVVGVSKTKKVPLSMAVTESSANASATDVVLDGGPKIYRVPLAEGESFDGLTFFDATITLRPSALTNDQAGPWPTTFRILDDQPEAAVTNDLQVLRATRLKVNASPEPVRAGGTVTVTGLLERANWDRGRYLPYSGRPLDLQFRTTNGTYATIKSLKTSTAGTVRTTVTSGTQDGYYRLVFAGTGSSGSSHTAGDFVDVR